MARSTRQQKYYKNTTLPHVLIITINCDFSFGQLTSQIKQLQVKTTILYSPALVQNYIVLSANCCHIFNV